MKLISQSLIFIFIATLTVSSIHHHECEHYSYEVVLELEEEENCDLCDVINSNENVYFKTENNDTFLQFKSENKIILLSNLGIVSPTYYNLRGPPSYNS